MLYHIPDYAKFTDNRHHTELVADFAEGRLAVFSLEPGQDVGGHQAPARVFMLVVQGAGQLTVGSAVHSVSVGDMAIADPYETHGMAAGNERFVVLAVIMPEAH